MMFEAPGNFCYLASQESIHVRFRRFLAFCGFVALITCSFGEALAQSTGKWVTRSPMPSSRTEVAAVEAGGRIYVIGGFGQSGDLVEEYDPVKDSWRRRAFLPQPLHHVGAAAVAGKIYVIGGFTPGWTPVNTVYEYDPSTDQWRTRAPMPAARGALAAGVIRAKIYAVGGVGAEQRVAAAHPARARDARDRRDRRGIGDPLQ